MVMSGDGAGWGLGQPHAAAANINYYAAVENCAILVRKLR